MNPLARVTTVFAGGVIGTGVRTFILGFSQPAHTDILVGATSYAYPVRLMAINTVGVLLASWLLHGPLRHPDRARARLFLLTGTLGGLTSYSALLSDAHLADHFGLAPVVVLAALSAALAALAVVGGRWMATRRVAAT